MPKATTTSDARGAARRFAGGSDESDRRDENRQARADESYAARYRTSANVNVFMTPDHDNHQKAQHQQRRQDFEWHYQETPPAQIQHSRQPGTVCRQTEAQGDGVDDDDAARGFKTPEPDSRSTRRPPVTTTATAANHSTTHTSDGEQQFQTAAEFAQSQYRRRNRLEKRLEELQKDVASLTLKLRSSSNRSNSTAYQSTTGRQSMPTAPPVLSETPLDSERLSRRDRPPQQQRKLVKSPPSPVVKIKKTRVIDKPRPRSNLSEHSTTPTKGRISSHVSVSTMRELHKVTTERDQLRFELEKMKRRLTSTEKKLEEATRAREAYEKLKAHCESLQESLDLSEKIRVRQKKLLQQLQLNQQQQQTQQQQPSSRRSETQKTREAPVTRPTSTKAKKKQTSSAMNGHSVHDPAPRYSAHPHQQQQYGSMHPDYDILDSLVNHSSRRRPSAQDQQQQRLGHRAAPLSTNTRSTLYAGTIAPPPRSAGGYTYADFDSLLQKVHSPHPYTMLSAQPTLSSFAGGKQQQASGRMSRRDQPTAAAASGSTAANPARRVRSKSQGPPTTTRPTSASSTRTKRSVNHFLAPTQASLQRIQAQQRARTDDHRRPFI